MDIKSCFGVRGGRIYLTLLQKSVSENLEILLMDILLLDLLKCAFLF